MYPKLINYNQLNKEISEINFRKSSLMLNIFLFFTLVTLVLIVCYFNTGNSKKFNKLNYIKKLKYIQDTSEKILNR